MTEKSDNVSANEKRQEPSRGREYFKQRKQLMKMPKMGGIDIDGIEYMHRIKWGRYNTVNSRCFSMTPESKPER